MALEKFSQNLLKLEDKLSEFNIHTKKLKALENFSQVNSCKHMEYLKLIQKILKDGFLGSEEAAFLSFLTTKYFVEQNFVDWIWRTPWLKRHMSKQNAQKPKITAVQQDLFDMSRVRRPAEIPQVPMHLLKSLPRQNNGSRL